MKETKNNTRYKIQFLAVVCGYGMLSIFVRNINLPSFALVLGRSAIAALALIVFMMIKRVKISRSEIKANLVYLLISGASMAAGHFCLFHSYNYTTVAVATLFYYIAPIILMIMAALVLKEKISAKSFVLIGVALIGMVFVSGVLSGGIPKGSGKGILLAAVGAFFYALYMLVAKLYKPINIYVKTCVQQIVEAVIMLVLSASCGQLTAFIGLDAKSIINLLILGIIFTGVAYVLYIDAIDYIPSKSVAILSYADPTVAVFISALFFKEPLSIFGIIGAVLIIGASLMSELGGKK